MREKGARGRAMAGCRVTSVRLRRRQQRDPDRRRRRAGLTARETDIVKLVARGFANEEIARRLTVKEGTLKIHLHNIYRKLNVDSRLSLTLYVQGKGAP